jgi:hypothetical protein
MLDEISLRKTEFVEGHRVILADGQSWSFPRPKIRFVPKLVDGKFEVSGGASFGPEFDANLDVLYGVTESDGIERLRVKFEMTCRLLMANYSLTPENLAELVVVEIGDPASEERWQQTTEVLFGNSPKPTASTSDAAV